MLPKLFVANWKMNKSFTQEVAFCAEHKEDLVKLSATPNVSLVICPSFPSLFPIAQLLQATPISVGAQQCSPHVHGAYTGQVSAQSLAQVGCTYCIVGHSEQRMRGTSSDEVAQQTERLFEQKIHPIICIGESKEIYEQGKTYDLLEEQLHPLMAILKTNLPFSIAYEPVWAIGTGIVPDAAYLKEIFSWLHTRITTTIPNGTWNLLYGGSVDPISIQPILKVPHIGGFLIGGASLDFQKLQKLV